MPGSAERAGDVRATKRADAGIVIERINVAREDALPAGLVGHLFCGRSAPSAFIFFLAFAHFYRLPLFLSSPGLFPCKVIYRTYNTSNLCYSQGMAFRDTLKRKMASLKQAIHLFLDEATLAKIEEYRYVRRFPSRAAAILNLLNWALSHPPPESQKGKPKASA